jgi:hypothetical protein
METFKSLFGGTSTFFGLTKSVLVIKGKEERLLKGMNTLPVVYTAMLQTIARNYYSLPDLRTMTMTEIRFFYDGMRRELKENGK